MDGDVGVAVAVAGPPRGPTRRSWAGLTERVASSCWYVLPGSVGLRLAAAFAKLHRQATASPPK